MVQGLWIPNPLTPQIQFNNDVLAELYNASFELMTTCQFKEYVISQRIIRWRIRKKTDELLQKINNVLDKDNHAIHVVHFSQECLSKITAGDMAKAERSHSVIEDFITVTNRALTEL